MRAFASNSSTAVGGLKGCGSQDCSLPHVGLEEDKGWRVEGGGSKVVWGVHGFRYSSRLERCRRHWLGLESGRARPDAIWLKARV